MNNKNMAFKPFINSILTCPLSTDPLLGNPEVQIQVDHMTDHMITDLL